MTTIRFTRREQEVMEIIFRSGEPCTAADVQRKLDNVSYSAARAILSRLVRKGALAWHYDGPRYVYKPTEEPITAAQTALKELVATFFKGSSANAFGALLALSRDSVDDEELARLQAMIKAARESGEVRDD